MLDGGIPAGAERGAHAAQVATPVRVDALNRLAWELRSGDARRGLELALRAAALARGIGYRPGLAAALRNAGTCRYTLAEHDAALADLEEARRLFAEEGDEVGVASALHGIGNVSWRRGDHPAALSAHLRALESQRAEGDRQGEADSLNSLGNVWYHLGRYARALEHYQASLALKEELGDRVGVAYALNNIGNIHGRLGDYAGALDHHERSLALKRAVGERQSEGVSLLNLGNCHEALGEPERALEHLFEAIRVTRDVGDRRGEAGALQDIGRIYAARGETSRGVDFHRAALEVARETGMRYVEADTLVSLGAAQVGAGEPAEAAAHLEEALRIGLETESRRIVYEAHRTLADAWQAAGDAARALEHHREYHRVEREVFNAESDERIRSLMLQAEVERTHREAAILRRSHDDLTVAYARLSDADEEKARLVERLRGQAEELERVAREDALTGLLTRRRLDEVLPLEYERARRFGRDLTVVLADLDRFKQVNDRFSHATGDEVLRVVGRLLREHVRTIDVVARYGGEELVLLLVETPPDRAALLCEKLRAEVEGHDWSAVAPGLAVTLSMGVCGDVSLGSGERMVAAADARMYEAKRAGRNRVAR